MANYTLVWTATFLRTFRKFLRRYPHLEGVALEVLEQLEEDPLVPRLKLHALKGKHRDKHAVRLNYSQRIVLILKLTEREVVLLDIGSHDEVYRD